MKINSTLLFIFVLVAHANIQAQTFTKITTGPVGTDASTSFGSSWIDIDKEDDLDLFVSNVYYENDILYVNNGNGAFTKITTRQFSKRWQVFIQQHMG